LPASGFFSYKQQINLIWRFHESFRKPKNNWMEVRTVAAKKKAAKKKTAVKKKK
jgi:hypothetical protein